MSPEIARTYDAQDISAMGHVEFGDILRDSSRLDLETFAWYFKGYSSEAIAHALNIVNHGDPFGMRECRTCGLVEIGMRMITSHAVGDEARCRTEWECRDAAACNARRFPELALVADDDDDGERDTARLLAEYGLGDAPHPGDSTEPKAAPELAPVESVYLYHWRFDKGEEFGLYRRRADADAKAAQHAGDGLSVVLGMAILGRPEHPAPGTQARPGYVTVDADELIPEIW